ncbi:hypothetical protein [Ferirhizobium litorale]|uniref:Uncharacterized protein n=1 Tax=Ferirhizobium litorale TaxID=2927786 RepID=A0AAE3U4H2_9HYPH|nr:hypothetical protein [Fererhizobium litorale]MDI7923413.1 hypothetical protein [Fererhizobium litorale]
MPPDRLETLTHSLLAARQQQQGKHMKLHPDVVLAEQVALCEYWRKRALTAAQRCHELEAELAALREPEPTAEEEAE